MFIFIVNFSEAQMFIRASDLFPQKVSTPGSGELNINQNLQVDTLISRYILGNKLLNGGMEGFRIEDSGYRLAETARLGWGGSRGLTAGK